MRGVAAPSTPEDTFGGTRDCRGVEREADADFKSAPEEAGGMEER